MFDINGEQLREGDQILYKLKLDYHRGFLKFYNNAMRIVAQDIIVNEDSIKKYQIKKISV